MACMTSSLKSRFCGCLVGALAGDCIGGPFEVGTCLPKGVTLMQKVVDFVLNIHDDGKRKDVAGTCKKLYFTDDTAMARSVAASLIHCQGKYDARDMARRFAEEYAKEPERGYGRNVVEILPTIGAAETKDVYAPARTQFDGSGSYGNGGAMRIAPVGLTSSKNLDKVIEIAQESAKLTHSHKLGYQGAVLQACAVHSALHSDHASFNPEEFIDQLLNVMEKLESGGDGESGTQIYSTKLKLMKNMLKMNPCTKDVAKRLGNEISAHRSVPSAIYSFIRCLQPVDGIPTTNQMERTIIYAISLDGDTDTIASMAGAIAGAYCGIEEVPETWMEVCEAAQDAVMQADQLYNIMTIEG